MKFSDVMKALRSMAVREGYVHPSFPERIKEIDTFSQRLRHQMVSSILAQKSEEPSVDPAKTAEEALGKVKA